MKKCGNDLRIVFMGTPDFAVASLRHLVEQGYNVVGVVTSPDRAAGRGLKISESAVKQYAVEADLRLLQPEKLRDPQFLDEFKALNADLGIVIAFRMLPQVVWSEPKLGTFNLHASLLPQYRGAAPINWAIINGEKQSGLTTFMLNQQIDKGAILALRKTPIERGDSAGSLHDRLMSLGPELVVETIEKIARGEAEPIEQSQSDEGLKLAPKIFRDDCKINWEWDCEYIYNFIRGLSPYPMAWSEAVSGDESVDIKIFSSEVSAQSHNEPYGTIISDSENPFKVACKGGFISIHELQAAGKRRMSAADFVRGMQDRELYTHFL